MERIASMTADDKRPLAPEPATPAKPRAPAAPAIVQEQTPGEKGGPKGLEPTRYGDWERKGIVSDF